MKSLKDRYDGERVFLVGNGPSIDKTPLDKLNDEYSFGLNKINDIYADFDWRPSFYALLVDELEEIGSKYLLENLNQGIDCITLGKFKPEFGEISNLHYIKKVKLKDNETEFGKNFHSLKKSEIKTMDIQNLYKYWPTDVFDTVYTYHSMYAIIQMSVHMGFDEIYLVGCDLGYGYHNPHMIFEDGLDPYKTNNNRLSFLLESYQGDAFFKSLANGILAQILSSSLGSVVGTVIDYFNTLDDSNRFDTYSQLQPEDLSHVNREMTKSHIAAKRIASDKGISIYNATVGGNLEVYPRVSLEKI